MGKTYLTEDEVREVIREKTAESSLRKVAAESRISAAYLSDILLKKRAVSENVAELFGFKRIVEITKLVKFRRQK